MTRIHRSAPRRLVGLMTSTALGGCLLLTWAGTPALASDECGPHVPGAAVVCAAGQGPYGRVTYDAVPDLDVVVEAGAELNGGIDLATDGARLTLTGRDAVLRSGRDTTLHIYASPAADVRVDVGDVHYTGPGAQEAVMVALVRSADINLGDVSSTARGAYVSAEGAARLTFDDLHAAAPAGTEGAAGVLVSSAASLASVDGGSITVTGDAMAGLVVTGAEVLVTLDSVATGGDRSDAMIVDSRDSAAISAGSVTTHGDESGGVVLRGGGAVTLDLGDVRTEGVGSNGIATEGSNYSLIGGTVGSVTTAGDDAIGLYLYADRIDLTGGSVTTLGDYSYGAYLNGYETVAFDFESVATSGYGSTGVGGWAGGSFDLNVGAISTRGDAAAGVDVLGDGDLTVRLVEVTTRGEASDGVRLEGYGGGVISVEVDEVVTEGDGSAGVRVLSNGGPVVVDLGRVSTGHAGENGVVTGAEAHGVEVLDAFDAVVSVDAVETLGDRADAIRLVALPAATVAVDAGSLTTAGEGARGVHIQMGEPGSAVVSVEAIATQGTGADGVRLENADTAAISLGSVVTRGEAAHGVWVEARGEADLAVGSVSTGGHGARAVHVEGDSLLTLDLGALTTTGDRASGLQARGVTIAGVIGEVSTTGYESHGVDAVAEDGLDLEIGRVRTAGGDALGVRLESSSVGIETRIGEVETLGGGAHGVVLNSARDIAARIGRIAVQGEDANGLVATSTDAQTIVVEAGVSAGHGVAVDLAGSRIDFTLEQGGVIRGGEAGVRINASNGSRLVLDGAVSSTHGPALDIKGGAAVIDTLSNGVVAGHVDLSDEDDVLNNAGRFTAGGLSDFGAGNDLLNNTGLIDLVSGTAPASATFTGLERLNNAGRIDLANGVAGDVFAIDGVLVGQAGNIIALDLDLTAAPLADRIEAGGFEGLSNIVLSVQGRASLGDAGVVIARSDLAQTGAEIDVTVADGGFVDFDLVFADGAYRLMGELAAPAFEPTKIASGAQHQWTAGADVASARFGQMRDEGARAGARDRQVWVQAFGGSSDIDTRRAFDRSGGTVIADLSHEVKSEGVQAGVDRAFAVEGGSLAFGVLAGAGKTELRFHNGDVTSYDGLGGGAYAHWISGPFSLGVLAKLDAFKLDYDWAEANLETGSEGVTAGLRLDAAWRFAAGAWHVEPQASLSWSDTSLDRLSARDGNEVLFGDTTSLIGRIGLRAGADLAAGEGVRFKPFASVHLLNEFRGENVSTLVLADERVRISDRAPGSWARAVLGAGLDSRSGLGGFIQGEADFGQIEGFTARAGLKFSW